MSCRIEEENIYLRVSDHRIYYNYLLIKTKWVKHVSEIDVENRQTLSFKMSISYA